MKIWNEYGSEHSSGMRIIGRFKDVSSAERAKEFIDDLVEELREVVDWNDHRTHFSDEIREVLSRANCYILNPSEIDQFFGEKSSLFDREGSELSLYTDEAEVTALIKVLVHKGARVEVFSEHDYPPEDDENDEE